MTILEEGLRYELLITISDQLDKSLRFAGCNSFKEVETQLISIGEMLDSLKCSVEYIQDMVCIYGLKIWYDEYNKLVSTYIDVEWNYIRSKELPDEALKWASSQNHDSIELSSQIKIKNLKKSENSLTFLGRVINTLLTFTDPRKYNYLPHTLSFFEESDRGGFSVTMNTFGMIKKCIGVNGMHGVDKLLSFMIVSEMYLIQDIFQKLLSKDKQNLQAESTAFGSLNNTVKNIDKFYSSAKKRIKGQLDIITSSLEKIGHLAILRNMSLNELKISARKDSQKLYMLIETMNDSLVNEMNFAEDNLQKQEIDAQNAFLKDLIRLSLRVGFSDPMEKVYFKPKQLEFVPLLIIYCLYNLVALHHSGERNPVGQQPLDDRPQEEAQRASHVGPDPRAHRRADLPQPVLRRLLHDRAVLHRAVRALDRRRRKREEERRRNRGQREDKQPAADLLAAGPAGRPGPAGTLE